MTGPRAVPGPAAVEAARSLLRDARRVVVLTGAGISTDSGIPDFRGPNGLWTRDPDAEKLASLQHYLADPELRRRAWLNRLDHAAWAAEPNAGHVALVELERSGRLDTLVTQNIDGLHQAAGSDPERVVEIHGTLREVQCLGCGARGPMRDTLERVRAGESDPPCLVCGSILKSATISFGQDLVAADLERSFRAAAACDLLLVVGTTLAVYPIAQVVPIAEQVGAPVVIVNGEPTAMDAAAAVLLTDPISDVLPIICG